MHRDISNQARRKQRTVFSTVLLIGLGLCGQTVFRETFDDQRNARWTGPVQYVERQPENRAAWRTSGEVLKRRDGFGILAAAKLDTITLTALNAADWRPTLDNSPTRHTVAMDVSLTPSEPQDDSVWETLLNPGPGRQIDRTLAPDGFQPIFRGRTGMPLHFYAVKSVVAVTTYPARLGVTWSQRRTREFPWDGPSREDPL